MALEFSICELRWERYRRVAENSHAREWLKFQATRGLAANTIEAYRKSGSKHSLSVSQVGEEMWHENCAPIVRT
jgi:hypothetical protein